jgi:hypothetical protein
MTKKQNGAAGVLARRLFLPRRNHRRTSETPVPAQAEKSISLIEILRCTSAPRSS